MAEHDERGRSESTQTESMITDLEERLMRHALGLHRSKTPYRNGFAAGPEDAAVWDRLVERGLATKHNRPFVPEPVYTVTRQGRRAINAPEPTT